MLKQFNKLFASGSKQLVASKTAHARAVSRCGPRACEVGALLPVPVRMFAEVFVGKERAFLDRRPVPPRSRVMLSLRSSPGHVTMLPVYRYHTVNSIRCTLSCIQCTRYCNKIAHIISPNKHHHFRRRCPPQNGVVVVSDDSDMMGADVALMTMPQVRQGG